MQNLAKSLAQELLNKKINSDEQEIVNFLSDNSEWEGQLHFECISKGNNGITASLLNDFISDVQFYMEELR